jgi:subtilisin family serine protease
LAIHNKRSLASMHSNLLKSLIVSKKLLVVAYMGFALLVLGATPMLVVAASVKPVQVATSVADMAAKNKSVEVLVLLDNSEEQIAERQANLHKVDIHRANLADYNQRMVDRKARHANLKAKVRSDLVSSDLEVLRDYSVLPILHVRIKSTDALNRLIKHGKVLSIDEDTPNEPFLAQSLPLINQPQALAAGYGGVGTTVAILDTGVDYSRSAFGSCASPGGACKVVYAADFAATDSALDDNGHGTNVAGIALGVAPGAKIAALDVFRADGYAYTSDIINAINWCVTNKATYNIASINMSLGGGRYYSALLPTDSWGSAIQNAVDTGIVVVAASGNNAYKDSLSSPAAYANVVSVGAVYDSNVKGWIWGGGLCTDNTTSADQVTCFSNSASFLTMLAPGAFIDAAGISMAGTSQASPHVAGAAAVLRAGNPTDTVNDIKNKLALGASVTDTNGIIKPRLDLTQALSAPVSQRYLQFGAASYNVSESGSSITIPVTRLGGTTGAATVNYATENGTAMAGSDYTAKSGTLSFSAGISTAYISVAITNDVLIESSETFRVMLSNPTGANLGVPNSAVVTIVDNDANIEFESTAYSVTEGGGITLKVRRIGNVSVPAQVKYATANGSARSNTDYTSKSGTLSWIAGDAASKSISVSTINDTIKENGETLIVNLSSASGATLGVNKTATVTIVDND